MISPSEAKRRAADKLAGFPPEIQAAYVAFAETGNPERLDEVVLGVLKNFLASPPDESLGRLPGTTRLLEDLGCDSLAIVDMLFLAESLFDIKISDEEMAKVTTLDALRESFRKKVLGDRTPAA